MHLVADLSQSLLPEVITGDELVSICQLGIFGTKYVRTVEAPEQIELETGQT